MARQAANRRQYWVFVAIVLLAFALRAYQLGKNELWFDEAHSASIAGKDWADILSYTQGAPFEHPPLYYLALTSWMRLAGTAEYTLRFFSLFWGVLLIPLLYRFVAPWGGRPLALLVGLVASLSPAHILQSQNARMYTLLPVLGILLLICYFQALASGRRAWWLGFALTAGLGVATHYFFILLLLVPVVCLALSGVRYRRLLVFLSLVLLGSVLLIAGWSWLSPGFRQAVQQVLQGEGGGVSSLGQRIRDTAGGLVLEPPVVGRLVLGIVALLGLIFWPLPPPPLTHPMSRVGSRRFLLIWLLVPWLAALMIPYWLQDRHLAYLWPALYVLMASGLLALRARMQLLFVAGLLVMIATSGYALYLERTRVEFEFGKIMAYIEDRALADDLVILNQPAMRPFLDYYAQRDLAVAFVPASSQASAADAVEEQLRSLVADRSRVWLGPIGAWTGDPESLVEQWLATHTFQAEKTWFPSSGSAALYFTARSLEPLAAGQGTDWEGRVQLLGGQSSPLTVVPGDAVRLMLTWQAGQSMASPHSVSLYLTQINDDASRVQSWAERHSEPCSGWCPTDIWKAGAVFQDRHALLIPPGTPPGSYHLQVAWYDMDEQRELVAGDGVTRVNLAEVQVSPATQVGLDAVPEALIEHPLQVTFEQGVVLLGFDLAETQVPAGSPVAIDLHWFAESAPVEDYSLWLELAGSDGQPVASWQRSPAVGFLPTSQWRAGEYLRGRHQLDVPVEIPPGRYRLRLRLLGTEGRPVSFAEGGGQQVLGGLIPWRAPGAGDSLEVAALEVTEQPERPHNLDLPPVGHTLNVQLDQGVELVGYDLATDSAEPGGQIDLTLYWRGAGPTDRPYKVFTHLSAGDRPPAQHDGPPGEGCCPTDTWVEGEVVVDRHIIALPVDLRPGIYLLITGMYDEASMQRLPILDAQGQELGSDQIQIAEVVVRPRSTPEPLLLRAQTVHQVYLPLVEVGW